MTDFEKLYNTYFNDVYLYIRRLSGDEHIAEEITSETFFKAMHSIDSFRGDCDVRVWLCQIAKNTYYAWYNEHKKHNSFSDNTELKDELDIESLFEKRELTEKAFACLHELEEPYKEVFMLSVFGQLSLTEISRLFGKSESWARVTFYRAKQKLSERMR